jgi:outer membrane receptor protein involved in Fe transport
MIKDVSDLLAVCLFFSACLDASEIKGKVVDPSGAPVSGAQVALINRVGVVARVVTAPNGTFQLDAPESPDTSIVVAAPGFRTRTLNPAETATVQLEIAAQTASITVVGSTIEIPAEAQGSSVDVIPSQALRERNEPIASDLLRYVPGVAFAQSGGPGGVTTMFLRGGNSNMSLVQIDGVPVIGFGGGVGFDFAHIPSEAVDHIDFIRGAQSAVYGSYANSGVIDFVTRRAGASPQLDVLAEGGSNYERRFGVTASGTVSGFSLLAAASRFDTAGMVRNGDYRNEDLLLHVARRFGRQSISFNGYFDSNEVGEPGAYGSDPKHISSGVNLVSRAKNNFSTYGARYEADLTPRVRLEMSGGFFQNNNGFKSKFGFSYNRDRREQGDARAIISVSRHDTVAVGLAAGHEDVKNTFITDASFSAFPIDRKEVSVYAENRYEIAGRLFLSAGLRGEFFRTPAIPGDGFSRPVFPAASVSRANPKLSAAYVVGGTRVHGSFGMGVRPPSGFELAFTNNPALKPERTGSFDAGVEQKMLRGMLVLDGTYFYNRYYDLIVTLGGSLTTLSHYKSDNLANSRAQGAEFSARLRPTRWVYVTGSFTLLETRILSLDGTADKAPSPFQVGQQLTRRPEHSGNLVATFARGRLAADVAGYFRGKTLYEEPNLGASNGLFWNPGFANIGINLNYTVARGLVVYGSLRNALNWHYEEVFGFPSQRLNFVTGVKWSISKAQ